MSVDKIPGKGGGAKMAVIAVVVVIVGALGAAFVIAQKKGKLGGGGGQPQTPKVDQSEVDKKWCGIRQAWQKKAGGFGADIMVAIASHDDKKRKELQSKRDGLASEFGSKILSLKATKPIFAVEQLLQKEGTARANVAIDIYNAVNNLTASEMDNPHYKFKTVRERQATLVKAQTTLDKKIKKDIAAQKASFDAQVNKAVAAVGGCSNMYRGPASMQGFEESPNATWEELEFRRKEGSKKAKAALSDLEPYSDYYDRVYQVLASTYRASLKTCAKKARDVKEPQVIQLRFKRTGAVASLGLVSGSKKFYNCLLSQASKWRFPKPDKGGDKLLVGVDIKTL